MFAVTEAEAAAIRAVFQQHGELSAAIELRRLFPGITDTAQARECVRTIAGWKPQSALPLRRVRLHPNKRGVADAHVVTFYASPHRPGRVQHARSAARATSIP